MPPVSHVTEVIWCIQLIVMQVVFYFSAVAAASDDGKHERSDVYEL